MTIRFVEADATPAAVAVIASVPAQPLSWYEPVATPATVAMPALNTALPMLAHVEEKVTVCGVVTGTPPLDTVTVILVLPNAESEATPRIGAETVTAAAPTAKPIEPVTALAPTWAVAATAVAPAAARVAELRVTVAMPEASVKAVAEGVMIARVVSVVNVTTELGTTAPAAFFNVAFNVAGAPLEIAFTVAPAALVSASVNVGTGVVVVVVVVPVVVVVAAGVPDPLPHPAITASVAARNRAAENREFSRRKKFRAQKKSLRTHASGSLNANRYRAIPATVQYFHYEHNDLSWNAAQEQEWTGFTR